MKIQAIDENGKFFVLVDEYGWAEADFDEGFNRTSTAYKNGAGEIYPRLNQRVLLVYAYLNRPDNSIQQVSVDGAVLRESSDAEDYADVAYNFNIALPSDGWYTIHTYWLPVDTFEGYYYDSDLEKVVNSATGDEFNVSDLPAVEELSSNVIQHFFTPDSERMLNDKVAELADLGIKEGKCSTGYKELLYANQFVDTQLSGAHVKFNDGYLYQATEILNDLNSSNPYEFC